MTTSPTHCLKCGHQFPAGAPEPSWCPDCGRLCSACEVPDEPPPVPNPDKPQRRWARAWWVFFALLLAPPVLMTLAAHSDDAQGVVLGGGGASALFCGIWLARRLFAEHRMPLQAFMAIVFAAVLGGVSLVLCIVGYFLGGGEFRFGH